ncbi:MAG: response regulator transcription factor [Chloroflexi bacterium]|nr:response regulator transcription factor [Chloroflexota bacterium]
MEKYAVLLVDDHPLIREGLVDVINAQADMVVVGEAENGEQALRLVHELNPCAVVLDIALPDFNGIDIAAKIRDYKTSTGRETHVIILSMFMKDSLVYQALQCGVRGYVVKTASSTEVVDAIRHVCQGRYYLSPEVSASIIPGYLKSHSGAQPANHYDSLSQREQQVFRLLAEGHSNREIADFLHISPKTVERHRANIMSKLNLSSYRDLLTLAIDLGIVVV